jgi:hypothetical protein
MRIIAFVDLAPGKGPSDVAPHVQDESRAVWNLHKAGSLRSILMRQSMTGAMLEFESPDVATVQSLLSALPAVQAGVLKVTEIVPLVPYTGYESLFAR